MSKAVKMQINLFLNLNVIQYISYALLYMYKNAKLHEFAIVITCIIILIVHFF